MIYPNAKVHFNKHKHLGNIKRFLKQIVIAFINIFTFLKVMIINPRTTGAIIPSSKSLAEDMVSHILNRDNTIVELGAGTGVITRALLKAGIRPKNIIVIESSHDFVKNLKQQFPRLRIVEGNAAHLTALLGKEVENVNTIISSIPLRSLPKEEAHSIIHQIESILPKTGRYIQYTYSFKREDEFSLKHFKRIFSQRIWLNVPPARVDVWEKR